jgi:hypothetical protein
MKNNGRHHAAAGSLTHAAAAGTNLYRMRNKKLVNK